jgi:glucodextranase-like protein
MSVTLLRTRGKVKRYIAILAVTGALLAVASAAWAAGDSLTMVQAPQAPEHNGYYWAGDTLATLDYSCANGAKDNDNRINVFTFLRHYEEGTAHITVQTNSYGETIIDHGDGTPPAVYQNCGVGDGKPTTTLWEGTMKVDYWPPSVTVADSSYPATTDDTLTVTGTATDSFSGIDSVKVNGVTASRSGSSYSATVPIDLGENAITIVTTDNAGRTDRASSKVFRRDYTVAEALGQAPVGQSPTSSAPETAPATPNPEATPTSEATPTLAATPTTEDVAVGYKEEASTHGIVIGVAIFLGLSGLGYGLARGWFGARFRRAS